MVVNIRKEIPFSCAFRKKFASHIKFGENVYPSFYEKNAPNKNYDIFE